MERAQIEASELFVPGLFGYRMNAERHDHSFEDA